MKLICPHLCKKKDGIFSFLQKNASMLFTFGENLFMWK